MRTATRTAQRSYTAIAATAIGSSCVLRAAIASPAAATSIGSLRPVSASPLHSTCRRAFSFGTHSPPQPSPAQVQAWNGFHVAALKYMDEGAYDKASMLFASCLREPGIGGSFWQWLSMAYLGMCFRQLSNHAEAKSLIMQAIQALQHFPDEMSPSLLVTLYREAALCSESMGDTDQAQILFEKCLRGYAQLEATARSKLQQGSEKEQSAATADHRKLLSQQAATHYSLGMMLHKKAFAAKDADQTAAAATTTDSSATTAPAAANSASSTAAAATAASTPTPSSSSAASALRVSAQRHYASALQLLRALHGSDPKSPQSLLSAPVLASLGTVVMEQGDRQTALSLFMSALECYQHHEDPRLLPLLDVYMELLSSTDPALKIALQKAAEDEANKGNKAK